MGIISVSGVDIHYQRSGYGPDIVMVHGLAANLAFWYVRIVPLLAKNYRVAVYDLRGHGLSGMPPQGYTTKEMVEDLHGLLEQTRVEKAHLVGHSLGGAVALHYAVLHPRRVLSLTLVDCRLHALQPLRSPDESPYWRRRRAELRAKGISIPDDTPKVVYIMLEELAPLARSGMANPNAMLGLLLSNGVWDPNSRAALRWKKLVSTTTFAEDIRRVAGLTTERIREVVHPTLLTYGSNSFCLETCRALETILPNHKTVIHDGVGHFYPVVAPDLLVRDLNEFLSHLPSERDMNSQKNVLFEGTVAGL